MVKFVVKYIVAISLLGAVALSAQPPAPKVPEQTKTISIADKGKYELLQLKIDNAIKDVQNVQLQNQVSNDRALQGPTANLNAIIIEAMHAAGIPDAEKNDWQYDPGTKTFIKHLPPPAPVAPAKPAEVPKPEDKK